MDFIGELAGQLGIDGQQAKALAGGVMGLVQEATREGDGEETAAALQQAVPELDEWKQEAATQVDKTPDVGDVAGLLGGLLGGASGGAQGAQAGSGGSGGGLGDLLGAAGSILGGAGGQAAQLAGLISKLGLDPQKAQMVAPMALNFLKSRLSPDLLTKVLAVAPFLTGGGSSGQTSGSSSGGGGLLGGLLG